jgi:DNA-binding MarR family transcriptional regulator
VSSEHAQGAQLDVTATQPHSADNLVHDLIAISNDLQRHVTGDLRRRGYEGLRPSFARLLSSVWEAGLAQSRLADELGVSVQAASQTVSLAEEVGYVMREPNPEDGRSKLVVITPLGRRFVRDGTEAVMARAEQYAEHVGATQLSRFEAALARLQTGFDLPAERHSFRSDEPRSRVGAVILLAERATIELRVAMRDGGHGALGASQNSILVHIGSDGVRASEIARVQRVSRQTISSTMHELESLGYLTRRQDGDDARGVVFVLTRRGRRMVDSYIDQINAFEQSYAEVLGVARFARFAETAHDLHHRIRLEHAMRYSPLLRAGGVRPATARPDGELVNLANDLHRWLGGGDTVRLAALLGQLSIDRSRSARFS